MDNDAHIDISTASNEFQRWWFSMAAERRGHIEGHLEVCRSLLGVLGRLDVTDRGQYPVWRQLRENSGWSIKKLAPLVEPHRTQMGRYERGDRLPGRQVAERYRALLWNLAADQYHSHLVRLGWALFRAEQEADAPEVVEATEAFLDWANHVGRHPLLGNLLLGLPYHPGIAWPLQVTAA